MSCMSCKQVEKLKKSTWFTRWELYWTQLTTWSENTVSCDNYDNMYEYNFETSSFILIHIFQFHICIHVYFHCNGGMWSLFKWVNLLSLELYKSVFKHLYMILWTFKIKAFQVCFTKDVDMALLEMFVVVNILLVTSSYFMKCFQQVVA